VQQPDLRTLDGARAFLAPKNLGLDEPARVAVDHVNLNFDQLLKNIWQHVPDGPGKTVAVRALHSAQMQFNSAIANGGM
jgi:hypothetical protein